MFVIVGLIAMIPQILGSFIVPEPDFTLRIERKTYPFWQNFKMVFKYKSYIIFTAILFFYTLLNTLKVALDLYVLDHVLELGGFMATIITAMFFWINFLFIFLAFFGIKKIGYRITYMITTAFLIAGSILYFFFTAGNIPLYIVAALMTGLGYTTFPILIAPMSGSIMDQHELKTGSRVEGPFIAMKSLFVQPANQLGTVLLAALLALFGYVGTGTPSPEAIFGIKIIATFVPLVLGLVIILLLCLFPIKGKRLAEIEQGIAQKRIELRA